MHTSFRILPLSLMLGASVFISACNDDSSSNDAPPPSTTTSKTVSGVAATGKPISGAAVAMKCSSGSSTATTAANGAYSITLANETGPCVLEITGGQVNGQNNLLKLHSAVASTASSSVANISPLTEMALAQAVAADPATYFATFNSAVSAKITTAALAQAQTTLNSQLALLQGAAGNTGLGDYFTGNLEAGNPNNPMDKFLDTLGASLASANIPLSQLVSTVSQGGTLTTLITTLNGGSGTGGTGTGGTGTGGTGTGGTGTGGTGTGGTGTGGTGTGGTGTGGTGTGGTGTGGTDTGGTGTGGTGTGGTGTSGSCMYLPQAGDTATFQTSSSAGGPVVTHTETWENSSLDGQSVLLMNDYDQSNALTGKQYLQYQSARSMRILKAEGYSNGSKESETTLNPNEFRAFPEVVGGLVNYSTTSTTKLFGQTAAQMQALLGSDSISAKLSLTIQYVGNESVTVPAGTFSACKYELKSLFAEFSNAMFGSSMFPNTTVTTWHAPGVGMVKSTSSSATAIGNVTSSMELKSGRFSGISKP